LPLLNSRHITLPQHNRLIAQIVGLERRVSRAGKDSIAHAPQGQDDLVNAVAGCAAALHKKFYDPFMGCGDDDDPDGTKAWDAYRLWQLLHATASCARYRHGLATSFRFQLFPIIEAFGRLALLLVRMCCKTQLRRSRNRDSVRGSHGELFFWTRRRDELNCKVRSAQANSGL
jgi:hypothetical protein